MAENLGFISVVLRVWMDMDFKLFCPGVLSGHLDDLKMEGCPSGWRSWSRKPVYRKVSRVQIPNPPPSPICRFKFPDHSHASPAFFMSTIFKWDLNNNFSELYKVYFLLSRFSCVKADSQKSWAVLQQKEVRTVSGISERISYVRNYQMIGEAKIKWRWIILSWLCFYMCDEKWHK